jgi:hypothetical protein
MTPSKCSSASSANAATIGVKLPLRTPSLEPHTRSSRRPWRERTTPASLEDKAMTKAAKNTGPLRVRQRSETVDDYLKARIVDEKRGYR